MEKQVVAGGGLVWDRSHLLVVHRPRYDDWTLPKGKLDPVDGGDVMACAVREVGEETGTEVTVGARAGQTRYRTAGPGGEAAVKVVDYWHMDRTGGAFKANREVDAVRWLPVDEVRKLLTYERDRLLLEGVTPGSTSALGVLRRLGAAIAAGDGDGVDAVAGGAIGAAAQATLAGAYFTDVEAGPDGSVTFATRLAGGTRRGTGHAVVANAAVVELHLDDPPD